MLGNPSFVLLSKERFEVNSGTVEPRACDREGRGASAQLAASTLIPAERPAARPPTPAISAHAGMERGPWKEFCRVRLPRGLP